ncbi:MAG: DNA mismatch repair endonuclease MutL [Chloroflexi bacterium]|nr:DNA mismatch repair endonuclease MutL [Chloroflexota bacterium]
MPIQILPDEVASQIAAGEVIERPASVVKELVENALDAGARQITIYVEGAGKHLVEVADDGVGIPSEELKLAVARHATSKLASAHDLFEIKTLGFRGEALASIGSVSRMTLISRQVDEPVGARLVVEAGKVSLTEPAGAPVGTAIRVEDLFFNVPARLKFLKQDITERQQIDALVTRYALAYPQVRFQLTQDGKHTLQTSGNGDRRQVLAALYGVDVAKQMLEVLAEEENLRLTGFISPLMLTRSNRKEITLFINGRWVQDISLTTALLQAYHTLLMVGRYPMAAIFLELPPGEVDVNVHPAKAEVRFRSPDRIFSGVQRAVRRALLAYTPIPQIVSPATWSMRAPAGQIDPAWEMAAGDRVAAPDPAGDALSGAHQDQPSFTGGTLPLLRLVGQVGATYLVAEGPDGLYLIDQHAAHERVLFEKMMAQRSLSIPAQSLLEPAVVQISPSGARLLENQLSILNSLGFHVESFGQNTFLVRAIPALLMGADPASALRVLVEDFEEDESPLQAEIEARLIARVCKRAAVKAGQALSAEEQEALVRNLEACQSPRTCPHGRPTMIHLSVDLLERQFGRRGAR